MGDILNKITGIFITITSQLPKTVGAFYVSFPIITPFVFLYPYPQPNLPGLPPYFAGNFRRNFPKIPASVAGEYEFSIMLYKIISVIHTLYRTGTGGLH